MKAVLNESDDLLNDPNFTERAISLLHHLAGATIQVADLVNYNCHPQEGGNYNNVLYNLSIRSLTRYHNMWQFWPPGSGPEL